MALPAKFYQSENTPEIARALLGKLLVVPDDTGREVSAMIVETEAYLGKIDKAAHSYGGRRTPRNEVMYGAAGRAYVFFVYGMYYQFNVVTGPKDHPHAILIRAAEPMSGVAEMQKRRGRDKLTDLASGPGKLCIALGITRDLNGESLRGPKVRLERHTTVDLANIAVGKRVGIDYAGEDAHAPLRFWIRGNPHVSKPWRESAA